MHRNIPLKKAGLYVLCFIFSFQLTGKEPDLNFTTFTSRDGLSSNTVNSVLEDHFRTSVVT